MLYGYFSGTLIPHAVGRWAPSRSDQSMKGANPLDPRCGYDCAK